MKQKLPSKSFSIISLNLSLKYLYAVECKIFKNYLFTVHPNFVASIQISTYPNEYSNDLNIFSALIHSLNGQNDVRLL